MKFFSWNLLYIIHRYLKYVLLEIMNSSWIFTFWKRFEHQNLGFTVSIATLKCMQNTQMQYLVISFIGDRYFKYLTN